MNMNSTLWQVLAVIAAIGVGAAFYTTGTGGQGWSGACVWGGGACLVGSFFGIAGDWGAVISLAVGWVAGVLLSPCGKYHDPPEHFIWQKEACRAAESTRKGHAYLAARSSPSLLPPTPAEKPSEVTYHTEDMFLFEGKVTRGSDGSVYETTPDFFGDGSTTRRVQYQRSKPLIQLRVTGRAATR